MRELLGRGRTSRLWVRFGRYSIGSVIAVVCSETTFVLCFGPANLGTTLSSVAAFVAGAFPNYFVNRYWAWGRRGRLRVGREIVLYGAVIFASLGVSIAATGMANRLAEGLTSGHASRTVLVSLAYLGTNGVLFLAKFAVFQTVIFTNPERPETDPQPVGPAAIPRGRSRHQVPMITRKKRAP